MISICVKNLNKRYRARDGDVPALADVDIEVREGEFVTIVGPSGCGKSTLLYILGGFLGADGGTIEVNGKAVTGPGRRPRHRVSGIRPVSVADRGAEHPLRP